MNARHSGLNNERTQNGNARTMHWCDGDIRVLGEMAANLFQDDHGGKTQNLVRHLVFKCPCPNIEQRARYYRSQ